MRIKCVVKSFSTTLKVSKKVGETRVFCRFCTGAYFTLDIGLGVGLW
jgi:hypothetical protein